MLRLWRLVVLFFIWEWFNMAETVVLQERYGLSCERIREIAKVQEVPLLPRGQFLIRFWQSPLL